MSYTASLSEPSFVTPVPFELADQRAEALLAQMTTEQKVGLISGHNSFFIRGYPELGIPELYLADATMGVNIRRSLSNQLERSTAFPAAICLAATWNPGLAYRYAHAIGEECRAGGVAILLGPGMNGYRVAQCGRNFEYFGEDPHLAAKLVERYVSGVLDTGTIPTLKHFVANETEFFRRTSNSVVDERTLHELYLPPFKAGIDAGAMAVMTSYNQLNGEWTGQSRKVISDLLRDELGFRWLVMTDWWSVWDAEKIIQSGQDLEMPGEKFLKRDSLRLLAEQKVTVAQIDRMARSILRTEIAMGLHDRPVKDETLLKHFPAHAETALITAREGIVLLKNDGLLPLRRGAAKTILLTGLFGKILAKGGGAAEVEGYDVVSLLAALTAVYGDALQYVRTPTDEQLAAAEVVIISTGTFDNEGWDRPFALPARDEAEVRRATELNRRTIVVVNSGGGIEMTAWNDRAAAIVYAWYPGQAGNRALAEILCGEVNPSGKLPITIEKAVSDGPGADYLPRGEHLYTGWEQDNNMAHPVYDVNYREGVFAGYRWYEAKHIVPLYAFGHGLSYTTFEYKELQLRESTVRAEGGRFTLEFTVANTGAFAGTEVAQVYVHDVESSVPRPLKELKGFARVTLSPGEKKTVRVRVTARDLGHWDVERHGWVTEPGEYQFLVGAASDQIRLEAPAWVE